jgi:peroxiredoxin Q/BCP
MSETTPRSDDDEPSHDDEPTHDAEQAPEFELPNVGPGPDPFGPAAVADEYDALVVLFQRDYYCTKCRDQSSTVDDRLDEFEAAGALPVSVLPESADLSRDWSESLGLGYPVLADADSTVADDYDQPARFGLLGQAFDLVGRMPLAVVLDLSGPEPTVAETYPGDNPGDRPSVDDLLVDARRVTGER